MALDIKIIQERIKHNSFFISKSEIIEFLIGKNLDPLEEYALFITCDKVMIFTPHEIESTELITILYNGYSYNLSR